MKSVIKGKTTQTPENPKEMLAKVRSILITGPPGIGKTTLVKKICGKLNDSNLNIKYQGFYTEEVRENEGRGRRLGFDIVSLTDGQRRGILAREVHGATPRAPMVGKYAVNLNDFEAIALEAVKVDNQHELLVIDEIGKMELKSQAFKTAFEKLKDQLPLLATVPLKTSGAGLRIVEELKQSKYVKMYTVSLANRNDLVDQIIADIKVICGQ